VPVKWTQREVEWYSFGWYRCLPVLECPDGKVLVAVAEPADSELTDIAVLEVGEEGFREVRVYTVKDAVGEVAPLCNGGVVASAHLHGGVVKIVDDKAESIPSLLPANYITCITTSPRGDVFIMGNGMYEWLDKHGALLHRGSVERGALAHSGPVFLPDEDAFGFAISGARGLHAYAVSRGGEVRRALSPAGASSSFVGLSKHGLCLAKYDKRKNRSRVLCFSWTDFTPLQALTASGMALHPSYFGAENGSIAVTDMQGGAAVKVYPSGRTLCTFNPGSAPVLVYSLPVGGGRRALAVTASSSFLGVAHRLSVCSPPASGGSREWKYSADVFEEAEGVKAFYIPSLPPRRT
jgi:hypothetical protein